MLQNHVEDNDHTAVVGVIDEVAQILSGSEPRVDVEEVLDGVAVVGLQIGALLEGRVEPQPGDTQVLEIIELAANAL